MPYACLRVPHVLPRPTWPPQPCLGPQSQRQHVAVPDLHVKQHAWGIAEGAILSNALKHGSSIAGQQEGSSNNNSTVMAAP